MPVNELIARGITPALEGVPNVLFQIAQLREAKARDAEFAKRTEILDRETAQNSAIRLAQLGWQADDRNRQMQEREDADRKRRMGEMLPAIEAGDPDAVRAAIEGIKQHNPELAATIERDPKLLGPIIRRVIGEKGPSQITTQPLPGVGTAVLEDGQLNRVVEPPSYAPERPPGPTEDERNWRFRQTLTPEQRAEWDRQHAPQQRADRWIPDGMGGYYNPDTDEYKTPGTQGGEQPAPAQAKAAPKVGEVQKGYRYKGGDPADPGSWVRVGRGASGSY